MNMSRKLLPDCLSPRFIGGEFKTKRYICFDLIERMRKLAGFDATFFQLKRWQNILPI
jgi:hypothetical protein